MYLRGYMEYNFLQGMGSTNTDWVNGYQDPFNKGPLAQAAALAATNKGGAYQILAPAFAKIQSDATAFVASHSGSGRSQAQATIDRWKASDWPMIQGWLNDWGASAAGSAPLVQSAPLPVTPQQMLDQPQQPGVQVTNTSPQTSLVPISAPGTVTYIPAATSVANLPSAADAAFGPAPADDLSSWLPWIAGAAVVGFMLSGKKSRK